MAQPNPYQKAGGQPNYPYNNQPHAGPGGIPAQPVPPNPQQGGYYDADPEMRERYEGGGMGRETWASESGYSGEYSQQQAGYYPSRASTPTYTEGSTGGHRGREPYPAWTQEANIPLSKEEIEDVLIDLANKFGFQKGELLS